MELNAFIHTFEVGGRYYIYDVNTDKILKVDEKVYLYLSGKNTDIDFKTKEYIKMLKNNGFLSSNKIKKTEHPQTKYLEYYINNKVSSIILQVTQNCNFRCEYCVYSGSYNNRVHTNKRMSIETAKKAVDYLLEHSKDNNNINISFYGGEPLLEFDLIKQVVEYSKKVGEGKAIYFNLTTNGTLFNDDIIEYFVKNKITAMISLDGDKHTHDKSRKLVGSDKSTHDIIMDNLRYIKQKYPKYYKEHITFNCVINPENDYECIDSFISKNDILKNSSFLASSINENYSEKQYIASEKYIIDKSYDRFLTLISKLNFVDEKKLSPLSSVERSVLDEFRYEKNIEGRLELPMSWHHGGPCLPGVYRIFITVDGDFYPCERVSENSKLGKIGSLSNGIDLEKAKKVLNIGRFYEQKCFDCWAYSYCDVCIAKVDDTKCNEEEIKPTECERILDSVENNMKDYCVLKSLGYQY